MSLSICEKCGGNIPLGPDASNRCENCGLGLFEAHADPFPRGHLGDYMLQLRKERDAYRDALERIANYYDGYNDLRTLDEVQTIASTALELEGRE